MLKILHVASFSGNSGDNANHAGTYRMLSRAAGERLKITEWEIRETFWGTAAFDGKFARLCNDHDFVLFGGGNYFELWVENSVSGTSINIPFSVFKKIKSPVVFHSLGFDAGQGYTPTSLEKTKRYFEFLLGRDNVFISLRNDGSLATAGELLGPAIAEHLRMVPDGGFFAPDPGESPDASPLGAVRIGINIAGDMLERRFGSQVAVDRFYTDFARFMEQSAKSLGRVRFRFFAHIFRDFDPITAILKAVADPIRRRLVEVAPHVTGADAARVMLAQYRGCDLVLGNRFHANVCPIGMGIPTVALVNYPQVRFLYQELSMNDRCVELTGRDCGKRISAAVSGSLDTIDELRERYRLVRDLLTRTAEREYAGLAGWLKERI